MVYEHHNILNGSNQEILNLHSPKPSPPGPLVSISRGPSKGSLREMLASLNISLGLKALTLAQDQVQIVLPFMPFERPPILRPGTLCP